LTAEPAKSVVENAAIEIAAIIAVRLERRITMRLSDAGARCR